MGVCSSLPNLVHIELWYCYTCKQLPSFGKLPQLKVLGLLAMPPVRFLVSSDDVRNGFPCLEKLSLTYMDALEEWSSLSLVTGEAAAAGSEVEQVILFPSLKILEIRNCPMLKRLPFPTSLQGSRLPLEILKISACFALDWSTVKFQLFVALEELEIGEFPDLASLPDGIQHHLWSTLKTLSLYQLSSLVVLPDWIGSLTSLREIWITECENIRELAEGLKNLANLRTLQLMGCHPDLKSRCTKETGEDWCKIANIPNFKIYSWVLLMHQRNGVGLAQDHPHWQRSMSSGVSIG